MGELGGRNLYGFVFNDSANKVDKDGRVARVDDALVLAAVGAVAACAAAEAYIQFPSGQPAIHNIDAAAASVADAIAEGIKAAAKNVKDAFGGQRLAYPASRALVL